MSGYSFENFYGGGTDYLSPAYSTGFKMSPLGMGFPGSVQTANQIGEAANAVKQGVKAFEVTMVVPETAGQIPKHHFDEMRALMKLSGVKPSLHGPLIDPAGFGQRGSWEGEEGRADNERQMFDAVEKAHMLDPKGNTPVVFHASNGGGRAYRVRKDKDGKKEFYLDKSLAVNQETGQIVPLEHEYKYRPLRPDELEKGGGEHEVIDQVDSINETEWESKLTELATFNKHADEVMAPGRAFLESPINVRVEGEERQVPARLLGLSTDGKRIYIGDGSVVKDPGLAKEAMQGWENLKKADIFTQNAELNFNTIFHKAYKFGTEEQRKELQRLAKEYSKEMIPLKSYGERKPFDLPIQKRVLLEKSIQELQRITGSEIKTKRNGITIVDERFRAPKLYEELEDFAINKSSETFSNMAFKSYEKYKDKAPVIAIENLPEHMGFSHAEQLRDLIEKSREKFIEKLTSEKGISKSKAKEIAQKHLGATWDLGHISTLRKRGFSDKDVIEQTKIMTKDPTMVKHLHINDNFGHADAELLPGMGNAPLKEMLEEIEKTGNIGKMRKIIEASGAVRNFKWPFHSHSMAAFGSSIYGMKMAPSWQGSYFGGYGAINPEGHHSIYGGGFTALPVDLGGPMAGSGQSRFGGTPMA